MAEQFKDGNPVIISCPLIEDPNGIMSKIVLIIRETKARDVEVYTMEVPYCHAICMIILRAIKEAGKEVNSKHHIVRYTLRRLSPINRA